MTPAAQPATTAEARSTFAERTDDVVQSLHRNGFLLSLILHVALLLVLALTVIDPPTKAHIVQLAVDFAAAGVDPVDIEEIAIEPPAEPQLLAVAPAIPLENWQPADTPQPTVEAIELAGLDATDPPDTLDVNTMLADVSTAIRPAGFTDGPAAVPRAGQGAGQRGGQDAGFGAGFGTGFGGELGRRLQAAGARTGDVQVSIAWDNFNDIDVHVMVEAVAPRRGISMINFSNRRGACGGWLDVDQNVVPMTATAVENVFWARGAAPYGRYTVYVHQFRNWGGPNPTPVHVALLVDGRQSHHDVLVHAGSGPVAVTSFIREPGAAAANAGGGFDLGSLAPMP